MSLSCRLSGRVSFQSRSGVALWKTPSACSSSRRRGPIEALQCFGRLDAGHHVGWVTGDEVYGGNPKLRTALAERGIGYVLAVTCSAEVPTQAGKFRADRLVKRLPKRVWQKLSAGRGAKGHRFYDWAVIDLAGSCPGHHQLLIRRNRATGANSPTTAASHPSRCRSPSWCESPDPGGGWKRPFRPRRGSPDSMSTRSATPPGAAG